MNNPPRKITKNFIVYMVLLTMILAFFIASLFYDIRGESTVYKKILMGTEVEVIIMDGDSDRFDAAAESAFGEIKGLEKVFSSYMPGSVVSRISSNAGGAPVKASKDVIHVVDEALGIARLTGGAFDPTVGALAGVWGLSGEKKYVPSREAVEKILPLVNFREVAVDEGAGTVALKKKGMSLNLGGLAKGFIVGRAAEVLKRNGVSRAIIKAGGDMFVFDVRGRAKKASFIIGIKDPRNEKDLLGEIFADNGAIATSGDYERFFMKGGKRYHHILDPATGFPAMRSRSVTIIAKDPTIADALSTAVFVLGPEKGLGLIESLKDVEGVVVGADGFVHTSSGFKGRMFQSVNTAKHGPQKETGETSPAKGSTSRKPLPKPLVKVSP
ncbi:MAG: FAD:protein FMN transferase [Thermodesulfobacteriota bacterium]|nr:MAG: FAD:protein FMN transferase [Thermodesulfobacteriota bacterium]